MEQITRSASVHTCLSPCLCCQLPFHLLERMSGAAHHHLHKQSNHISKYAHIHSARSAPEELEISAATLSCRTLLDLAHICFAATCSLMQRRSGWRPANDAFVLQLRGLGGRGRRGGFATTQMLAMAQHGSMPEVTGRHALRATGLSAETYMAQIRTGCSWMQGLAKLRVFRVIIAVTGSHMLHSDVGHRSLTPEIVLGFAKTWAGARHRHASSVVISAHERFNPSCINLLIIQKVPFTSFFLQEPSVIHLPVTPMSAPEQEPATLWLWITCLHCILLTFLYYSILWGFVLKYVLLKCVPIFAYGY